MKNLEAFHISISNVKNHSKINASDTKENLNQLETKRIKIDGIKVKSPKSSW